MVFVLYLIIGLGVVALVGGAGWILKIAFGISTGQGLLCLFFFPVFLAMHWDECRLPFFINLSGILVFVVGMMGFAGYTENAKVKDRARVEWEDVGSAKSGGPVGDPWWDENKTDGDFVETDDFVDGADDDDSVTYEEGTAPAETPRGAAFPASRPVLETPTPLPHWLKKWGREVKRDEYEAMIGSFVEVYTADGQTFKVLLVAVSDSGIRVKERVGTGSMVFSLEHKVVHEMRTKD